jgi:hypothetical protein
MGKTVESARGFQQDLNFDILSKRELKMAKSQAKFEISDKIYGQAPIKNTISNFYRADEPDPSLPNYDYG